MINPEGAPSGRFMIYVQYIIKLHFLKRVEKILDF